jgi:hypothetical protein
MSYKKFTSSANPKYPVPGDIDVFTADCPEPHEIAQGKVVIKTKGRCLSVFESQLRPVADYFEAHPEVKECKVKWTEEPSVTGRKNTVAHIEAK